ncbi:MAG TPA: hypothetical protein DET40_25670 [Lentisphaeria bacterium]|nr:MAG: hypothetical protein A2X45_14755 [Lentisphaerae bacterium GWF2_50_93]HCE46950.1 hypothetical protein [Lentisphaeria bacterium]
MKSKKIPIWLALCGMAVQIIGIGTAIAIFSSERGGFSFLNNFVSELGAPRNSAMGQIFNWTMIISSLMVYPLMCSLGMHIGTKLSYAATVLGTCALAGAVGVGFAPMDLLIPHIILAMMFFWGWLFSVILFTIAFCRRFSFRESPALVIAGILAMLACCLFLAVVFNALHMSADTCFNIKNPQAFKRPAIWDIAILEWCVVLTLIGWNLATLRYLMGRQNSTQTERPTSNIEH